MRVRFVMVAALAACGPDPLDDGGDDARDGATADAPIDAIFRLATVDIPVD